MLAPSSCATGSESENSATPKLILRAAEPLDCRGEDAVAAGMLDACLTLPLDMTFATSMPVKARSLESEENGPVLSAAADIKGFNQSRMLIDAIRELEPP